MARPIAPSTGQTCCPVTCKRCGPHLHLRRSASAGASVEHCRTEALGGHVYHCPDCDETVYRYHSCRNRHCPKCQGGKAYHWLEQQHDLLLPVPYFMLTFTLPDGLRPVARSHQNLIYDLLFRTSAAATQHLARDPRFIGGPLRVGMAGVLHTWGRTLTFHPHPHYLIPAGGLTAEGIWVPAREDFLLPVKALSSIFRATLRAVTPCVKPITSRLFRPAYGSKIGWCTANRSAMARRPSNTWPPTSFASPSATAASSAWRMTRSPSAIVIPTPVNPNCSRWRLSSLFIVRFACNTSCPRVSSRCATIRRTLRVAS